MNANATAICVTPPGPPEWAGSSVLKPLLPQPVPLVGIKTKPLGRELGRGWPSWQLFRVLQMMLDGRKRFLGNCFTSGSPLRSVLLKEVHRLFMRIHRLIGICFVKILCGHTVQVVDELLMLCI